MPRVTQSHRDGQTARILEAAEACFSRRGFRATSMDEIITTAGMSSSTVYRYFPQGKESLVAAVLERSTDPMLEWMAELVGSARLPAPQDALLDGVTRCLSLKGVVVDEKGGSVGAGRASGTALLIHAWLELSPDAPMRRVALERYRLLRSHMTALVSRWQEEGRMTDALAASDVAGLIHRVVLGLIVDLLASGTSSWEDVEAVVRATALLLAPRH